MGRTDLFREGARLPEELARLLFLEPVISGRRVLEVGARSDSVAAFLIELGASRVVCAHDDKELVEALRGANRLDRVDFRVIRPGVLPGDDGAFDLVIDFSLPAALAAGQTFRLTDIARLLSDDGFAVTALCAAQVHGLQAILGGPLAETPVGGERSAAGLGVGPVGYRGLVEALKLQFDVVQVYFQSLLLGYLFGSFDVEPSGDGVSPNTSLMGGSAEPAGHYLFSFGTAVPVIEDVALVQVPFHELLARARPAGEATARAPATLPPMPAEREPTSPPPDPAPAPAVDDEEREALRAQAAAQEAALYEIAARMERLRGDIGALVETLDQRTRERDEAQAFVEGLEAAVAARDATLTELHEERRRLVAAVSELERSVRAGSDALTMAEGTAGELARLRDERAQLVEHIARVEGELVTWQNRGRILEEAHEVSRMRIAELEDAFLSFEGQRGEISRALAHARAQLEDQAERTAAERSMLDAAVATHQAQVLALERTLDETRAVLERERVALGEAQTQIERERAVLEEQRALRERIESELTERVRVLEAELADALGAVAVREQALVDRDRDLEDLARSRDRAVEELAQAREHVDTEYRARITGLEERHEELEADARRLADGVKTLVQEREEHRREAATQRERAEQAQAHAEALDERARAAQGAHADAEQRAAELQGALDERERRQRAAHAALEESQKQLAAARDGMHEVAGQRDTLKQVVAAREREILSLKDELGAASAEVARAREQADVQHKALADARQRLQAIEVERAQYRRREEELGSKNLTALGDMERARADVERVADELAAARAERRQALDDAAGAAAAHAALLDEERAAHRSTRERVTTLELTLEEIEEQREDAAAQVARAEEELRVARLEHGDDRSEVERLSARAELLQAALDEAGATLSRQATQLAIVKVSLEEGRGDYDRKHAEAAMLRAALGEARSLLDVERARGDLFHEELGEAHEALVQERARGDLRAAELEEAQQHILEIRKRLRGELAAQASQVAASGARAELAHEILAEAQERLARERTRADLLDAQLSEAQQVAAEARSYASLLAAELEDARGTYRARKVEHDAALEAERLRSAAALNDGEGAVERLRVSEATLAHTRGELRATEVELAARLRGAGEAIAGLEGELKVLKEQAAETRSDAMLNVAEIERLSGTLASAERERDSLLADLSAHQNRAASETQRRIAVDEELTRVRVAHNQALAEVQRMKTDLEAGKRAPEVEAEVGSLKQRVEALEKDNALKEAEIADKLQRIKQLSERLEQLTDRLGRVETYRS
ncbi:MAG: hypothetical protein IT383_15125 [Deltaproteobacteria bacterium]|nr:hypothetical protein [Deltaproteobacteria bacterium]